MSIKIGICGLAGSGKDTAALILRRVLYEQGKSFEIDRYAALLKKCAQLAFGDTFDDRDVKEELVFVTPDLADRMIDATDYCQLELGLSPDEFEIWNDLCTKHLDSLTWVSPRLFQQLLGTEVGRTFNPSIWVDYLQNKDKDLIVPDVRFGNENTDVTILITRHAVPQGVLHSSELYAAELQLIENPYDYVDYVIHNGGTLEELETKLRFLATTLKFK